MAQKEGSVNFMGKLAIVVFSTFVGLLVFYGINFSFSFFQKSILPHRRGIVLGKEISILLRTLHPKVSLVDYKWFSNIVEILLTLQKKFGLQIHPCLRKIRSLLIDDVKLERKRFGEILSSLAQFAIISLMTVIFYLSFTSLIVRVSPLILIKILCFQALGSLLFFLVEKFIHKKYFDSIDKLFCSMMKLSVLSKANLPNQKILSLSLDTLPSTVGQSETTLLKENLLLAVEKWTTHGSEISGELDFQMAELGDYREFVREKFLRFVNVFKFSTLCFFFLPSYLFLILELSQSFLID